MSRDTRRATLEAVIEEHQEGPFLTKAIVGFSYNYTHVDDLDELQHKVLAKVAEDRRTGQRGVSHVLHRLPEGMFTFDGENIDLAKFNFLVNGVPSCVYTYLNVMHSDVKEIAFVVNPVTKRILQECQALFGTYNKRVHIVEEGSAGELSFTNTFRRGINALGLSEDEQFLFIAGDLPLSTEVTINDIIYDPATRTGDALFDFNILEQVSPHGVRFPLRNYHVKIQNPDGSLSHLKEPNYFVMNSRIVAYIELFAGARKNGGIPETLFKTLIATPEEREVMIRGEPAKALTGYQRNKAKVTALWKALGLTRYNWSNVYRAVRGLGEGSIIEGIKRIKRRELRDVFKHLEINPQNIEAMIEREVGLQFQFRYEQTNNGSKIRTKHTAHADQSRVNDYDAIENADEIEGMLAYASAIAGSAESIYAHTHQIDRFRREVMQRLKTEIALLANYYEVMNKYAKAVGYPHVMYDRDHRLCVDLFDDRERREILGRMRNYRNSMPRQRILKTVR